MKIKLNHLSVSIEGDYYQVLFEEKEDNGSAEITDDPYFLMQRQFEMYDGGEIYIESHDENYIGHFLVKSVVLKKNSFELELNKTEYSRIEVNFKAEEKDFNELQNAIKDMISEDKLKIITNQLTWQLGLRPNTLASLGCKLSQTICEKQ